MSTTARSAAHPHDAGDAPLVVGVDCSTHGVKAIAWTLDGEAVAEGRAPVELQRPAPGRYEQRASDWLAGTLAALGPVGAAVGPRVRAVGLTHQRETFVDADEAGAPLGPAIVWMDERAWAEVAALRAAFGEERFHRLTGKPLSMTPSVTKILWLRAHEPARFGRAARWLAVAAYLTRALTGAAVTSVGSAEPTGLVDLRAGRWSAEVLRAVGLDPSRLPALVPTGAVAATLLPTVTAPAGLPAATPLVLTAGDGQVAALGAQVYGLECAYLNLGTAIVAGTVSDEYLVDRAFRTMAGAIPGTFLLESDLKGGTFTIDWLCERLLGATPLARLEAEAATLPPGADGLLLVPYLATVMDPYWDDDASGLLVGLRGVHGPAHLLRAVFEGIAFEERLHLDAMGAAAGRRIEAVNVLGGGATSDLWCRILADVLGRPVRRTRSAEATSLGAAMLAAAAVGLAPSARAAADRMGGLAETFVPGVAAARYERLYRDVYAGLYPALRESLGRLAAFVRSGG
ncbi:MAG: xylulose kinase [Deltaproteobacteria bacterium]|nr:xylulose kinase [Deltaproteobacteria bacterium]